MVDTAPVSSTTISLLYTPEAVQAAFAAITPIINSAEAVAYTNPAFGTEFVVAISATSASFTNSFLSISRASGSAVACPTGVITNVLTLPVLPGLWIVQANLFASGGAITGTAIESGVSTAIGTLPGAAQLCATHVLPTVATDVSYLSPTLVTGPLTTTNYFANVRATYTVGALTAYGTLTAIRSQY